jgi:hypothetical protein
VVYKLISEVKAIRRITSKKIQALHLSHRQQSVRHDYHILYKKRAVISMQMQKKRRMRGMPLVQYEPRKSIDFDGP